MKIKKIKGFTLVELIIVITILAILATIAFVSFQSYTKNARDANRLSSLGNIETGLQLFQVTSGDYPLPDNSIQIFSNGNLIGYQGYMGESISKILNTHGVPKDPFDGSKFLYTINSSKKKYQIMAFLENTPNLAFFSLPAYAATNIGRTPYTKGNPLGTLLNTNNTPVTSNIDIATYTGSEVKAYFDNTTNGGVSGTGAKLFVLEKTFLAGGVKRNCYEYLQSNGSLLNKDGIYIINPSGNNNFNVYCDMTTDEGGWTFIGMSTGASSSGTSILTNAQIGDPTNPNALQTIKLDTSSINSILFSGKNTLRLNNTDGKKRVIEYENNGQKLDFEKFKSYTLKITEPTYGNTSPFFTSHPHFILFTGITSDLPIPIGCTSSYERINYGYYIKAQERYSNICTDGLVDGGWTPFLKWSGGWQASQYYNYKLFVK